MINFMKVKLPNETDGFKINPITFCGIESYLIIPEEYDVKWNPNNLIYRSLIVDKESNEVLSSGWMKFFNYGESPELYPNLLKHNDHLIFDKIDGSLVIVDYVNGEFSMRTRGTESYKKQLNASDFELLPKQYPKIIELLKINTNLSLLFEIETPNNIIVVKSNEVKFTFLGAIDKKQLKSIEHNEYLELAKTLEVPIPNIWNNFNSIDELINCIRPLQNKEGIVLCYNNNQNRVKIKSDWYIKMHRIMTGIKHINHVIDIWVDSGYLERNDFELYLTNLYDYELTVSIKGLLDTLYQKWEIVKLKLNEINLFVNEENFSKLSKKEKAEIVISKFSKWSSVAFNYINNKKQISNEKLLKYLDN